MSKMATGSLSAARPLSDTGSRSRNGAVGSKDLAWTRGGGRRGRPDARLGAFDCPGKSRLTWYPPSPGAKSCHGRLTRHMFGGGRQRFEERGTDARSKLVGLPGLWGCVSAGDQPVGGCRLGCGPLRADVGRAPFSGVHPTTSKYAGRICTGVRLEPPPRGRTARAWSLRRRLGFITSPRPITTSLIG